ncbi:hypothetical protein MMC10_003471 [Thelotrema lepadinum]|nr:hypothetical protein [Thelotrema lepadinum]
MARLKTKGRAPTAKMASHSLRPGPAIYYGTSKQKQDKAVPADHVRKNQAAITGGQKKGVASKEEDAQITPKRGRGRPRKVIRTGVGRPRKSDTIHVETPKKTTVGQVGRPKKEAVSEDTGANLVDTVTETRGRGRPRHDQISIVHDIGALANFSYRKSVEGMPPPEKADETLNEAPRPRGRPPKGGNAHTTPKTSTLVTGESGPGTQGAVTGESGPSTQAVVKRGRGRLRGQNSLGSEGPTNNALSIRNQGQPATASTSAPVASATKRGRGRPPKKRRVHVQNLNEQAVANVNSRNSSTHSSHQPTFNSIPHVVIKQNSSAMASNSEDHATGSHASNVDSDNSERGRSRLVKQLNSKKSQKAIPLSCSNSQLVASYESNVPTGSKRKSFESVHESCSNSQPASSYESNLPTGSKRKLLESAHESSAASIDDEGHNGYDISPKMAPKSAKTAGDNSDSEDNDNSTGYLGADNWKGSNDNAVHNEGIADLGTNAGTSNFSPDTILQWLNWTTENEAEGSGAAGAETGEGGNGAE